MKKEIEYAVHTPSSNPENGAGDNIDHVKTLREARKYPEVICIEKVTWYHTKCKDGKHNCEPVHEIIWGDGV